MFSLLASGTFSQPHGKILRFLANIRVFEGMGRPSGVTGSGKHIWKEFCWGDPEVSTLTQARYPKGSTIVFENDSRVRSPIPTLGYFIRRLNLPPKKEEGKGG